jgi:hypothetical protein
LTALTKELQGMRIFIRDIVVFPGIIFEYIGSFMDIDSALDVESEFRVRKPKSISSFRGFLEISPMMSIAVWSYLKVVPNNFGAPKKVRYTSYDLSGLCYGLQILILLEKRMVMK